MPASMASSSLYLLDDQTVYTKPRPSGTENLTALYGLTDLASSVARVDAQGQKRKLRKSYKNHVSDLPGKHVIPTANPQQPSPFSLLQLARQPPRIDPSRPPPPLQPPLNQTLLSDALALDRTPATGIPDVDVSLLAAPSYGNGQQASKMTRNGVVTQGTPDSDYDSSGAKKNRKKKRREDSVGSGSDLKRLKR